MHFIMRLNLMLFLGLFISLQAFAVEFFFNRAQFMTPDKQHYIETYVAVPVASLVLKDGENNTRSAAVDITITFSKEGEVIKFDKYRLNSPVLSDTASLNFNLLDVKRFPLDIGTYDLEVSYVDANEAEAYGKFSETVTLVTFTEGIVISEISLLESMKTVEEENQFTKNGFELLPYVFPYYNEEFSKVRFYFEIYNTDFLNDSLNLVSYYISSSGQEKVVGNRKGFKKHKNRPINMILGEFDVADLRSGNYDLVVEVRNTENELLAQGTKFFQLNIKGDAPENLTGMEEVDLDRTFLSLIDAEKALFYCKALEPIAANEMQSQFIRNITEEQDEELQKRYLYNFWKATSPNDPERAFWDYAKVVDQVEDAYKTGISHGFETDRGWIYLKYGRPNQVKAHANFDPNALPYEIWQYYNIPNGQTNINFIFYSQDYSSNDYELLHSDARGEIKEDNWKKVIYGGGSRMSSDPDPEQGTPQKNAGSRVDDF